MNPVLIALASAAGGAFLFSRVAKAQEERARTDAARQATLDLTAKELKQGHAYAVQMMVDPRAPSWGGPAAPRNLATAAALIKATYQQLGWRFLNEPATSSGVQFIGGQPALWIWSGVWTRPEPFQPVAPGWAVMTLAQELPSLPATT